MMHQTESTGLHRGKGADIKIKPGTENAPHIYIKRHDDMFIKVVDLADTIYSNQTGAFPFTLQHSNRYIMVAIHINTNCIFCKPMTNKTEGKNDSGVPTNSK